MFLAAVDRLSEHKSCAILRCTGSEGRLALLASAPHPALPPTKWRRRLISVRPHTFTPWEQNTCGRARRADTFSARRAALSPCPGLPHIPSACEGMRKFVRPRPGSPLLVRHARPNARVLYACEHARPHLPVPTCSATLANNAFPVWPHSAGCLTLCCGAAARSPVVRDRVQLLHMLCVAQRLLSSPSDC